MRTCREDRKKYVAPKGQKLNGACFSAHIYVHNLSMEAIQLQPFTVTESFLLMLNERVGALETSVHHLTKIAEKLMERMSTRFVEMQIIKKRETGDLSLVEVMQKVLSSLSETIEFEKSTLFVNSEDQTCMVTLKTGIFLDDMIDQLNIVYVEHAKTFPYQFSCIPASHLRLEYHSKLQYKERIEFDAKGRVIETE